MLRQKNILLGVCGSIAAYKSALLVRLLVKEGANVRVIMTPAATGFISPLTLGTLSRQPVLTELAENASGQWNNHVALGEWADLLLVAPASAHTAGKFALGLCDNLLSAVYLSARCPVYIAPAMDVDMWRHPAVRHNIELLEKRGNRIIPPTSGELASGLTGEGRLAEPEEIVTLIAGELRSSGESRTEAQMPAGERLQAGAPLLSSEQLPSGEKPLAGKKVLVTAGPTQEAIDPVRYIGNHSSGKMGFALAAEFARRGAEVELVSGPVSLETPHPAVRRTNIVSADEMHRACMEVFPSCDIAVLAAAVADYRPVEAAQQKIKKQDGDVSITLRPTRDILADLGRLKKNGQVLAGFALETGNELENARAKLLKKNLDLIVLNSLRDEGAGFGTSTNKITLLTPDGDPESFPLKAKTEVAGDIVEKILTLL